MTFDQAFDRLIGHEGGYVFDPHDPGGETKFGISKRAYPALDIAALTLADAKAIYRRDYWDGAQCDRLPPDLAFDRFNGHRLAFMTNLSTWQTFGKGWARRIAVNLQSVGK